MQTARPIRQKRAGARSLSPLHLWWAQQDSNLQPRDYESPALTIAPWARMPERKRRRQKPPPVMRGGDKGVRTPDLVTASHALSQLSYIPKSLCEGNLTRAAFSVKGEIPSVKRHESATAAR